MKQLPKENTHRKDYFFLVLFAFLLRAILAAHRQGFYTDIYCFFTWARNAFSGGIPSFYSSEFFSDYPPGYIYVLYVIGAGMHLLGITEITPGCLFLLKLPAILCDLATGYLIWQTAAKKRTGWKPVLLSGAYLLNPAVLFNSAVWGQVDAVYTFFVIVMCLLLRDKKTIPAYFVFATGILLKPQTMVFTPLLLLGIYENVFAGGIDWKNFARNLLWGLASIGCMVLACLPFGLETVIQNYSNTMGSYPYISVNAYNFWAMLGLNWKSQDLLIAGLVSYKAIGTLVILAIVGVSICLFIRNQYAENRYWITGTFIIFTFFLFSVRMHERYLFPVMIFLLLAYADSNSLAFLWDYAAASCFHFLNTWHVFTYYTSGRFDNRSPAVILIAFGTVISGLIFYRHAFQHSRTPALSAPEQTPIRFSLPLSPFKKADFVIVAIICLIYSMFAFRNLGDSLVPQSAYHTGENENIMLYIPEGQNVQSISGYLGYEHDLTIGLWEWDEETCQWDKVQSLLFPDVYSWKEVTLEHPVSGPICLIASGNHRQINELVLQNTNGDIVLPTNCADYSTLFDEQSRYPAEISFMNSSYFDEIYYTRTAYEMLNGLETYEWTHPPLGKIFIALSVLIFGANPFGFRFIGTVFGILMLPIMYLLARNLFQSRKAAAFSAFLFAFDFMHFTQTRITTIDVYVVFFIILMYYFMEQYTRRNFNAEGFNATLPPLLGCGIAFGLGIACKWTGFYAGGGLAILFFATMAARYWECRSLSKADTPALSTEKWNNYRRNILWTIAVCILFFILIPALIYTLSYLPFRTAAGDEGLIRRMLLNQKAIFHYHSTIDADHPYASSWFQWPAMIRPILYYTKNYGNGLARGISAFGNPMVWWVGLAVIPHQLYLAIFRRDRAAAFLAVGFFAEYLPWLLVSRCTFIYHYFPCVPFLVLMITNSLLKWSENLAPHKKNILFAGYAISAFGLFLLFYPVISGAVVSRDFVQDFLKWLDSWVLIC